MTPRIANMMYSRGLSLRLTIREPETGTDRNWYECAWFFANMLDKKGRYLFHGEGLTPEEAIKDMLECNAFSIEEMCKEIEALKQPFPGGQHVPDPSLSS